MFANTGRTGCRILLVLFLASPAMAITDTPGGEPCVPGRAAVVDAATPVTAAEALPNPILFVTQVPLPSDFTTVASVFGNHQGPVAMAPRGGDLYILYPDGTLKNLTQAAGYGMDGFQGATSIAVREPAVHWSGTKALFSMIIGAPVQQYVWETYTWQLYEITGLGKNDTPVITKVPHQPEGFNNVAPLYGTDERILFTSDRPRSGELHLYPQLDEYEEAPTVTGLWSLDPSSSDLRLLNHSPSGVFSPTLDSYGRVVFTRWDHLQRDQQADADFENDVYGTFNYASESATAVRLDSRAEVFPEPRSSRLDLLQGTNLAGHSLNHFFPWQIREDGTEEETLNHIGRHELHSYFNLSLTDDPNLTEFIFGGVPRTNPRSINNMLQIKEDPTRPGTYVAIDAPEFYTHAAGQIISLTAPPEQPADQVTVTYVTHRDTAGVTDGTPSANHSGFYRNPLPLSSGQIIAAHTAETRADANEGTRANPLSRYDFRMKTLKVSGSVFVADQPLTQGISKSISYWDPDVLVSYNGLLWELDPVEVRARTKPAVATSGLEPPEQAVFTEEGVDLSVFRSYMRQNGLSLIVSRNITTRDVADRQQPFNLRVPGSSTQTIGASGKVYDVPFLQLFQADQIRGLGGTEQPRAGRRVLAQLLHEPAVKNPPLATGPAASVKVAADGSAAAFVPSHRATTWQLTDGAGTGVVRERYWLTFQPGEIRLCTSCHGLNSKDQANGTRPENKPEALRELLRYWKSCPGPATAVSPAPGATGYVGGTLTWSDPGSSYFDVYFDTVNPPEKKITSTTYSSAKIPVYFPNQTYYWRVVACGLTPSNVFSFTTGACPWTGSAPQLLTPANNSPGAGTQLDLTWQAVPGAAHYAVYLGTADPPVVLYRDVSAPSTSLSVRVNPGSTYFWRVVAYPGCSSSAAVSSPTLKFTTGPGSAYLWGISPGFVNRWVGGTFQITGSGLSGKGFFTDRLGQDAGALNVSSASDSLVTVGLSARPSAAAGRYDIGVLDPIRGEAGRLNGVLAVRAFTDVTESEFYFESSDRITTVGVMEADFDSLTEGPQFAPSTTVTRAEMADYLAKAYQWWRSGSTALPPATCVPSGAGSTDFPDVPCSHPRWLPIHWIKQWGVTSGAPCPQGVCFLPANSLTRGEMVTFLERLKQGSLLANLLVTAGETDPGCAQPWPTCSGWTDPGMQTAQWPRREVNVAFSDRLTAGCAGSPGNGLTMCVLNNVTRGEIGEFLARVIGLVPNP